MSRETVVDLTLGQILSASGQVELVHVASHLILLKEYFRRMALWFKALNCTDKWPFFDAALEIDPLVRADDAHTDKLNEHMRKCKTAYPLMWKALTQALHWGALIDDRKTLPFLLPDPYAPLVIMHQRGGYVEESHGFIYEVTYGALAILKRSLTDYDQAEPIVELDDTILNKIDEEHNLTQTYGKLS